MKKADTTQSFKTNTPGTRQQIQINAAMTELLHDFTDSNAKANFSFGLKHNSVYIRKLHGTVI